MTLATGDCTRGVAVSLRPRSLELSASSPEVGSASAKLPAKFLGGGDSVIHTGFDPEFLPEALCTLPDKRVIVDLAQNGYAKVDGSVVGQPALFYEAPNQLGTGWRRRSCPTVRAASPVAVRCWAACRPRARR